MIAAQYRELTYTLMSLQKIDGSWRIAHEHASMPFYMDGSRQAALDLTPS